MDHLCAHFGVCGGCAHQDMADSDYRVLKRAAITSALERHGLGGVTVEDILTVAPATRRRAALKAAKRGGGTLIGFHAARAHSIVDMHECLVLTPTLAALVPGLRAMMNALLGQDGHAELHLTEADNGIDLSLRWSRRATPALIGEVARWAATLKLARVTAGGELLVERAAPVVQFGEAKLRLPAEAFLQPTREGEAVLQTRVRKILTGAKTAADLFSGCGTFALPLAGQARVHAVEWDAPMLDALAAAARVTQGLKPVTVEKRDLFKRPLGPGELARFDAVVLDPPRAGAAAQAGALAEGGPGRIAYISCNPQSFARDARLLVAGGYGLKSVLPVDQFLWSSHIELVAGFER